MGRNEPFYDDHLGIEVREKRNMIALVYLALIAGAELLTVFFDPQVGMAGHSMVLVALLFHSSLTAEHPVHRLLLALSLAPLTRILSLASPLVPFSQIYWYLVIGAPLLAAALVVIRNLNLRPREIGFTRGVVPVQLLVAVTGVPFGLMEYQILSGLEGYQPLIDRLSLGEIWLPALILLVATGFVEELIFRGVLQRVTGVVFGGWGLIYVSALFAVLHVGYLSVADVAFVFVIAMFFSWVVKRTGSILGVTLSHGLTNIVLFLVVPLL